MDIETVGDRIDLVPGRIAQKLAQKKLGTFEGVFTPVCLSMFSAILFLRLGFILGNAGLLETLLMMCISYSILIFTVLSISAISTNGAIEGGGIYYMSSRVLGPEFGGAIGVLFFAANIVSSAFYITGCVEGLVTNFGPDGTIGHFLPGGEGLSLVYATLINFINLVICIFGAKMFAKTSLVIFGIVVSVAMSVMMSLLFTSGDGNTTKNVTDFTGLDLETFKSNLYPHYTIDHTTNTTTDFSNVFGVFFTGVTGVLAGANISGDLKNPSKSIPLGTLSGIAATFSVYVIMFLLSAASCSRKLLQNNYFYMQYTNVWPPLVEIGISSATISASLTSLIGASRLLNAVAADKLFGWLLDPVFKANVHGNPIGSVLMTWFIIQVMILIGSLDRIAQISSILFLFTYFSLNFACMMCLLTSAPNFRPSFKYFNLTTSLLGLAGSFGMTFVVNPLYSSLVIIVWMLLMVCVHFIAPTVRWGDITQALIFHQVRKYLLMLDHKKDHVKYWRPRILLMVENPRSCMPLVEFVNDMKKSGLFVIGHVEVGNLERYELDPMTDIYPVWLKWLDQFKVKAFIEMTMAPSVREGLHHVARIAGLGAMKLNTVIFGFYDEAMPVDFLQNDERYQALKQVLGQGDNDALEIRRNGRQSRVEYVSMVKDAMTKLQRSVCLARHFHLFDKKKLDSEDYCHIDIWPVNFFDPNNSSDNCISMIMQLGCILHMVPKWKSATSMRLMVFANHEDHQSTNARWQTQLKEMRINADLNIIVQELVSETNNSAMFNISNGSDDRWTGLIDPDYIKSINRMMVDRSAKTAVSFLYLPSAPKSEKLYEVYLDSLEQLTRGMPPLLLVHGNDQVVSTSI